MKFEGFDPYINVHTDNKYQVSQFDKMIEEYQEKFKSIKIDDVEEQFVNVVTKKQPDDINPEYLDFCQKYIKRKGLDVPKEPVVVTECHKIGYDENGRMTFEKVEMEDDTQIQEEPQENAPLSFSENALEEVQENEDDEWKGFPSETIVPIPTDEIDEEICNVKSEKVKKSKKKSTIPLRMPLLWLKAITGICLFHESKNLRILRINMIKRFSMNIFQALWPF